jgi:5'-3' exonuclease
LMSQELKPNPNTFERILAKYQKRLEQLLAQDNDQNPQSQAKMINELQKQITLLNELITLKNKANEQSR